MLYWPAKSPGEVQDFEFDFSAILQAGEKIASKTVTPTGVTIGRSDIVDVVTGDRAGVQTWLSGGTLGTPGVVSCTIVTDSVPARTYSETAIVPIGEEPVSLTMAKAQCNAQGITTDDELFLELIQSAREHVEQYCGTRIAPVALEMTFASFAELERLTAAPVQSIAEVKYLDATGVLQTLDPSVYEFVNVAADPLRPRIRLAYGANWPTVRPVEDAVRVSAVAGYTVVPKPVIRAILTLISHWYDNRSGIAVDVRGTPTELPHAVTALLANYRR